MFPQIVVKGKIMQTVALELYKMEVISLGKMAELLGFSKQEAMRFLNSVDTNWLEDDTQIIAREVNQWL